MGIGIASPLELTEVLRALGRGADDSRDLAESEAHALFSSMLEGGIPPLELGALLASLRWKHETAEELAGFSRALNERVTEVQFAAHRPRLVVIPAYGQDLNGMDLLPVLAIMLSRFDVPVLVHGMPETDRPSAFDGVESLGIGVCASVSDIQLALASGRVALAHTATLSPALAALLSVRERLCCANSVDLVARLLDPAPHRSLRLVALSEPRLVDTVGRMLSLNAERALLLHTAHADALAEPGCRPRIDFHEHMSCRRLFEAETTQVRLPFLVPYNADGDACIGIMRDMLDGQRAIPQPVLNLVAACLFASGCARDLAHAKALVAVGLGSPH